MAREPTSPRAHQLAAQVGKVEALDAPAEKVAGLFAKIYKPGKLKNALSGTFLGHPLHPLLTDLPIGTWTSALLLDVFGGGESETASRRLIGAGLLAAAPTAASGWVDWGDTVKASPSARRIGLVHASANVTAIALYTASYLARRRGESGKALAFAGIGALTVGGHLGGHLSYVEGVGVSQNTFEKGPKEWTRTVAESEVEEGSAVSVDAGGVDVMVAKQSGRLYALANRCSHRGGPLSGGELTDGCVSCPWHGSVFRLDDGGVERGPASVPQPLYEARVSDGHVEVRLAADPAG